jgi:hypothetical protein
MVMFVGSHLVKATESIIFNLGLVTDREIYNYYYVYNICNVVDDCDNVTFTACILHHIGTPSDV